MNKCDQQPWPGQTPRRWRRAWLSRWMKGCSQLTLQTGNRTTLSWQQTAGHHVSVISKWKMLRWESHEYNYTGKHMLSLRLLWRWWWCEKQLTSYGSWPYFVIFIHATSVPGLNLKFKACRVQNKSDKSICGIKHIHGFWTCTYVCMQMLKLFHSYILVL